MKPERWQQLDELFHSALEREPAERSAFLDEACAGDKSLHKQVEELLTAHGDAGSFIEKPAFDLAARRVANECSANGNPQLTAGQIFGHYRIVEQLGAGGMGEVYLAEDTTLGRKVALKLLPADFTTDKEGVRRFQQEARTASALNHPNIITIHEIAHIEDRYVIATEFIDGETLRERIRKAPLQAAEDDGDKSGTALPIREVLNIAIQIADALVAAHEAGIVHRDIKPENIMVRRRDGYIKVLDFGLAKLSQPPAVAGEHNIDTEAVTRGQVKTSSGLVMGTLTYMSPEQTRGEKVDQRTDIWSLGAVLYELVAGRAPFERPTPSEIIAAILDREPPPLTNYVPGILSELQGIISKALTKDKEQRYQTARDLLADLRQSQRRLEIDAEIARSVNRESGHDPRTARPLTESEHLAGAMKDNERRVASIAVLPFVNMSADPENEFFCEGLAEELLNALTKIRDLKVAARTSAFSFKGNNSNVNEIGAALGVNQVLEGSVRKSGDQLRISVRLINASDGYHLWSQRYDGPMRDIFDLQDDITIAVVNALKLKLLADEKAALLKRHTDNPQAYELYLKGRHFWNKRTAEGFTKGIEQFQQAIEIDPNYALAYAGIADCYLLMPIYADSSHTEVLPKAKAAVLRALQIDDSLAEAHVSLGWIYLLSWQWRDAEEEFKRGIQLNPAYPIAHLWYSNWLNIMGRFDEAMRELKRAQELDPLLPALHNLPRIQILRGELDAAIALCNNSIELDPNYHYAHVVLALAYQRQGRYEEAITEAQKGVELSSRASGYLGPLGYCYAVAGRRSEALAILRELEKKYARRESTGVYLAWIHAGLGDKDQAFAWLEKDFRESSGPLAVLIRGYPVLDTLHSDARWNDLLRRMGLPIELRNRKYERRPQVKGERPGARATGEGAALSWWLRSSLIVGALALAIALLVIGPLMYRSYFRSTGKNFPRTDQKFESIAVLPFTNASGDPEAEYLSDGFTESLINSLSRLEQLKVMPRTLVFIYKGKETNPERVGRDLGVDAILTGRLIKRGETLDIQVDLIDMPNRSQVWGQHYDENVSTLAVAKQKIAFDVAEKLLPAFGREDAKRLNRGDTANSEAYTFYLRGRQLLNRGRQLLNRAGQEDKKKARSEFQQAIDLDQNYALAWAGLAESYGLDEISMGTRSSEMLPKAREYIERALRIDDSLAEVHTSLAIIEQYSWNFSEADREFKRAIELNANYPMAHRFYGGYLGWVRGRFDDAMVELMRAQQLDPLSLNIGNTLAQVYVGKGEFDKAIKEEQKVLELDPSFATAHRMLALIYRKQGRYAEAFAELGKALESSGWDSRILSDLGVCYALSGKKGKARALLKDLKQQYDQREGLGQHVADVYAALDEKDQAFGWLERDFQAHSGELAIIGHAPRSDILRAALSSDPRWNDLLRRIGIPPN